MYTYADLLHFLGLSNWQFLLILLLSALLWAGIWTLTKLGLFGSIKISQEILPKTKIVYISYQGSYNKISPFFQQAMEDFDMVFKLSIPFGIYYDNPSQTKNAEMCRALIGVAVDKCEQTKIQLFLSHFPQYRTGKFPKTSCFVTRYPYFNSLSCLLAMTRVYQPLMTFALNHGYLFSQPFILETYHLNDKNPLIGIMMPSENFKDFLLWYTPTAYTRQTDKSE